MEEFSPPLVARGLTEPDSVRFQVAPLDEQEIPLRRFQTVREPQPDESGNLGDDGSGHVERGLELR